MLITNTDKRSWKSWAPLLAIAAALFSCGEKKANLCLATCKSDSDCFSSQECSDGLCRSRPCESDAECGTGKKCFHSTHPREAVPQCHIPCNTSADCASSSSPWAKYNPHCNDGNWCGTGGGGLYCDSDADCASNSMYKKCNTELSACTCAGDEACGAGYQCAAP